MKKIALSLAVLATIALASCGNKAAENADSPATDSPVVTEETIVATTDSDSNGQAAAVAVEETTAPAEAAPADAKATDEKAAPADAKATDEKAAPADEKKN